MGWGLSPAVKNCDVFFFNLFYRGGPILAFRGVGMGLQVFPAERGLGAPSEIYNTCDFQC